MTQLQSAPINAARVIGLKREATRMKRTLRIKQTAALARIAQREGFSSWEALMCAAGGRDAVHEAKFDAPPTQAQVARAERHAARLAKYGPQGGQQ